jgi:acetyltransferase-like isoleucine patch superfamily enzyme
MLRLSSDEADAARRLPEGVSPAMHVSSPLFLEPHVRLMGGTIFAPVWIGRRSYANNAIIREKTRIGRYCSIARRITIGAQNHPLRWLSTHPFQIDPEFAIDGLEFETVPTTIGNDVWIGENAIVMSGVRVGDGAVVAAGSVVTKDAPPYAIVAGAPARAVGQRFPDPVIRRLLDLRWWEFREDFLKGLVWNDVEACISALERASEADGSRSLDEFEEF